MELTESQLAAVRSDAPRTLCVAGAGAGKTAVLAHRVMHLLTDRGCSACDILMVTFTRKAAAEMRERIELVTREAVGNEAEKMLRGLTLGTFHSVALSVVRAEGERLNMDPATLTVLDREDSDELLKQCCREAGLYDGKKWKKGVSWKKVKERGPNTAAIYSAYLSRLKESNALDYGGIITTANTLLLDLEVAKRWQGCFKHILIDELQDCDTDQHTFCERIAGDAEFFAVGDLRQRIYGWRGAGGGKIEGDEHGRHYDLSESFRCADAILAAANSLAQSMPRKALPPMTGCSGVNGKVEVMVGRSSEIAAAVKLLHKKSGYAWREIAVLYRTNWQGVRLAGIFREVDIPLHRVGSAFDKCETERFRAMHAALRLVVNVRDDAAFLRLSDALGWDAAHCARNRAKAARDGCSHFQAAPDDMTVTAAIHELSPQDLIQTAVAQLWSPLGCGVDPAVWWRAQAGDMTIEDALRWFAGRDSQDDLTTEDEVTLSTIHSAKGLEWPAVIIPNCNEGSLPSSTATRKLTVDEERRVMYVAMTRAKERLILHYRRPEDLAEGSKPTPPSRFLYEAGLLEMES